MKNLYELVKKKDHPSFYIAAYELTDNFKKTSSHIPITFYFYPPFIIKFSVRDFESVTIHELLSLEMTIWSKYDLSIIFKPRDGLVAAGITFSPTTNF